MITDIPNYVVNAVAGTEMNPNPFPPFEPPKHKPQSVHDTTFQDVFNTAMEEIKEEEFKKSYKAAATERYGDEV